MKFVFAVFISLITTSVSIFAWDGNRQGFLYGFGAGTNSVSFTDVDAEQGEMENFNLNSAITNFRIGYAPINNFAVLLYGHGLSNPSSYYAINIQRWSTDQPQANSWFGGMGFLTESAQSRYKGLDSPDPEVGFGVNFGYGREIIKHASIETNLTIGVLDGLLVIGSNITFHLLGY